VNVAGQALVPTIVAKREGILDLTRYGTASSIDALGTVDRHDDVEAELVPAG
jgi:hypothetical protein